LRLDQPAHAEREQAGAVQGFLRRWLADSALCQRRTFAELSASQRRSGRVQTADV